VLYSIKKMTSINCSSQYSSGIIRLAKPLTALTSIARAHQPLLLTIMAEEVRTNLEEPPAMASTVTIALLLGAAANNPPYFDHKR